MKKLTAIALISIALVSCKKETKTITKVDPKTGKTITVEVPVEDSAKTVQPAVVVDPAIKEENGVYKQSFKLEKGKTYPLMTVQKETQTLTAPDGKSQSGSSENVDDMSFTVNDFQNGVYDISINLLGKKMSQTGGGKTIVVDTKLAAPTDEQQKLMWNVNKALVGNKLQMKMQEDGKIVSITGFEPIYQKVIATASTAIKDAKMKQEFIKAFKQSFSETTIKDQFMENLMIIPTKGVKVGEKWTKSENATPDGKVKITTTHTLKSVDNGVVQITITGGIPQKSQKQNIEGGGYHSMSSELSQSGTVTLNQNTGWITNQNIVIKMSQTETISDGKQTQSMKSASTSTVSVNP